VGYAITYASMVSPGSAMALSVTSARDTGLRQSRHGAAAYRGAAGQGENQRAVERQLIYQLLSTRPA